MAIKTKRFFTAKKSCSCSMPGVWRAVAHSEGAVVIFHSPRACAHVARTMDIGSEYRTVAAGNLEANNSVPVVSSMLEEKHSIFGGIERLGACIDFVVKTYRPECIVIANSCVAGVIGDDVEGMAKEKEAEHDIPILTVDCYGFLDGEYFKGYYETTLSLIDRFVQKVPREDKTAILVGDSGGPWINFSKEVTRILNSMGIKVLGGFPGYTPIREMKNIARAEACLALTARGQNHRDIFHICELMQERFGMKYIDDVFPIGVSGTMAWIRKVGEIYGLEEQAEIILKQELANFAAHKEKITAVTRGKSCYIIIGRLLGYFDPANILETAQNLELDVKGIILLDVYEEKNLQVMLARLKELTTLTVYTNMDDEKIINSVDIVLTTHDLKNLTAKAIFIPMLNKAGFVGELELMQAIYRLLCSKKVVGGLTYV
ncbi:MAG: nitrogenase component 1 [Phascolarctobacterium sp.]|nr:nitrogenase component 1 [Phascolarctobacterium sp.]